jgi:hypothetical protein
MAVPAVSLLPQPLPCAASTSHRTREFSVMSLNVMVGAAGFEPATPSPPENDHTIAAANKAVRRRQTVRAIFLHESLVAQNVITRGNTP